jgi:hypothetical protein
MWSKYLVVSNPAIRFCGYPKSRGGNQNYIHSWSDFDLQRNHLCLFQRDVGEARRAEQHLQEEDDQSQRDSKMDPQEEIIQKPNPRQFIIIKPEIYTRLLEIEQRYIATFFETTKTFCEICAFLQNVSILFSQIGGIFFLLK